MMAAMGRTAVAAAVLGALAGAALPACDLMFAPARGPGAHTDAAGDAPGGGDGATTIDAQVDAPPGSPDAPLPPDAACSTSYACYTVDLSPGFPAPAGTAGCEIVDDDVCTTHPDLVP